MMKKMRFILIHLSFQPGVPMSLATPSPNDPDRRSPELESELNQEGPDSSRLLRRGALVPPKMESEDDDMTSRDRSRSGRASQDTTVSLKSKAGSGLR